jgi:hypothetical protein
MRVLCAGLDRCLVALGEWLEDMLGLYAVGGTAGEALGTTATPWHQYASSLSSSSCIHCVLLRESEDVLAVVLDDKAHGRASERPADPRRTEQSFTQGFNVIYTFSCVIATISHPRRPVPHGKASRETQRRDRDAYTARPHTTKSS